MAQGIYELLWLKIILEDLGIKCDEPIRLYCNNKYAIRTAHNSVQQDRTKHIEIDQHFIKEKLDSGQTCIPYVSSQDNLVMATTLEGLFPSWEWKMHIHQFEGECQQSYFIIKVYNVNIPE